MEYLLACLYWYQREPNTWWLHINPYQGQQYNEYLTKFSSIFTLPGEMLRGFMEPTNSTERGKKVIMLWTSFDYCREYPEYNKQADELMRGFVIKKKISTMVYRSSETTRNYEVVTNDIILSREFGSFLCILEICSWFALSFEYFETGDDAYLYIPLF